jgi:hypothetical protein
MSNEKKAPKRAVSAAPIPDAIDLREIERHIERLEKEKAELEAKSKLLPGRSQHLAKIDRELLRLGWARVSATEHVRASPHQSEIYEREAAAAKRDAARQEELEKRRLGEVAAQGGQSYREALRAFAASWKKRPKVAAGSGQTDDDDNEPK